MTGDFSNSENRECRLKPDLQLVAATLSMMKEYFQARGLQPSVWFELELAAAEALNNAIEHGCAGHPEAEVVCRWRWTNETIGIEITDAGNYQPPRGDASLPDDPLTEEGRGAFLIARLVDTVEHASSAEGHLIRLTKRVLVKTIVVPSNGSTIQNETADDSP
jgi:anti-sigma regulatory factor (Ser/Thr protein kinase)